MKIRNNVKLGGFTLVELLVVISIIAVLLSIMLPSLRKARESATSIVCKSRLNDLQIMTSMYTSDNNGLLPDSLAPLPDRPPSRWPTKIGYYTHGLRDLKSGHDMFRCPKEEHWVKDIGEDQIGYRAMYGYNEFFAPGTNNRLENIVMPSELAVFADVSGDDPLNTGSYGGMHFKTKDWCYPHPVAYKYGWAGGDYRTRLHHNAGAAPIHNGAINYVMADGSVRGKGMWPWDPASKPKLSDEYSVLFHPQRNLGVSKN